MSAELVFATALAKAKPGYHGEVDAVKITKDEGLKKVLTDALGLGKFIPGGAPGGDEGVIPLNARDELVAKRVNAVMEEEKTRRGKLILSWKIHGGRRM
jgi:hypothetical protein